MSDLGCAMAQLGARSAEPPPDRTFCGYCAPQFGLGNCRIACGTAMIIGDVAMPYVAGWRPFDDRSGSQKRFCAGVEVDDPGMWAALLEQHLGPPCCCRTRSRRLRSTRLTHNIFPIVSVPSGAPADRAAPAARWTGPGRAGAEIAIGSGRVLWVARQRSCTYLPSLRQERGKIDATIKAWSLPMATPPRPASRGIGTRRRRSVLSQPPCRRTRGATPADRMQPRTTAAACG
jgi:hypothetical protein